MKKLLFTLLTCALSSFLFAQVTTEPYFITADYSKDFKVIFDATQGNEGMKGAKTCYAHTGVILDLGGGKESGWTHATKWGDNSDKYKLSPIGEDLWELNITGGIQAFYGLSDKEVAKKLCFVFRSKDNKQEGKAEGGKDIYYELYPAGLELVTIDSPINHQVYKLGDSINFKAVATSTMDTMKLTIDEVMVKKAEKVTELSTTYKCTESGDKEFVVTGIHNDKVLADTVSIYVRGEVIDKPVPAYLEEGINYPGGNKVGLVFRAPLNKYLYVLGDFNDWLMSDDYQMFRDSVKVKSVVNPEKDSINTVLWWCEFEVEDPTKKYAFQYLVDGELKVSDPYSRVILDPWNDKGISIDKDLPKYPAEGDGLVSVLQITNPNAYKWEVTDFKAPAPEDLNIYELHIRDFVPSKRLWEVAEKLDYLKTLGINAIELMPIQEFDGNNSWGYNPNHYFAYDKAYAGENWYKHFIDLCHQKGIAVILDMVFNHATGQCPMAKLYWKGDRTQPYNPWFNEYARHPFNVFSDFNHEYEGTRSYFKKVLAFWLEEYKVDGYRMDLSKGFTQKKTTDAGAWSKYDASRIVILKDYYDAVVATKPNAYFILEHLGEYKEEKELADYGMLPWRKMTWSYGNAAKGSGAADFVDSDGKGGMFANQWVGFAESHDEERNFYEASKYGAGNIKGNPDVYLKRVPAIIAFSQLLPGPKMMWQFGELGYDFSINYCMSGEIKDDCRTYEKPNPWKLGWDQDPLRIEAYENSSKIIRLRTQHPEFFTDKTVTATACRGGFSIPKRIDVHYVAPADQPSAEASVDIIILANFNASAPITTAGNFSKVGIWHNYMTGEQMNVTRINKTITLQPGELLILTSRKIDSSVDVEEVDPENANCQVLPTITNDLVTVIADTTPDKIEVYSLAGAKVASVENEEVISLANQNQGMYLVRVLVDNKISTHKIIKQ